MDISNKVALVTGSTRGIGYAIAKALAYEGTFVYLNSAHSQNEGKGIEQKWGNEGYRTHYIQADVSSPSDVQKMFAEVKEKSGRLDILVNNAAVFGKDSNHPTFEEYAMTHRVNGFGVYLCCHYAPLVMERGKIINISSIFGLEPNPQAILASGVKAEIENFTKAFAKKYEGRIKVNSVAPGYTDTPLVNEHFTQQELKEVISKVPLKRLLHPDEVVHAVLIVLAQDQLNGETMVVDAGGLLPKKFEHFRVPLAHLPIAYLAPKVF